MRGGGLHAPPRAATSTAARRFGCRMADAAADRLPRAKQAATLAALTRSRLTLSAVVLSLVSQVLTSQLSSPPICLADRSVRRTRVPSHRANGRGARRESGFLRQPRSARPPKPTTRHADSRGGGWQIGWPRATDRSAKMLADIGGKLPSAAYICNKITRLRLACDKTATAHLENAARCVFPLNAPAPSVIPPPSNFRWGSCARRAEPTDTERSPRSNCGAGTEGYAGEDHFEEIASR